MTNRYVSRFASAVIAIVAFAGAANAATIGFDGEKPGKNDPYAESGFSFSDLRVVGGNCLDGSCAALSDNDSFTMSLASGEAFDFTSFSFQFIGKGSDKKGDNTLTVTADNAATISFSTKDFTKNSFHTLTLDEDLFSGVRSLTFTTSHGGNIRLDSFDAAAVSQVPLPATIWLSAAALGGLGLMRRRKKQA